MRFFNPLAIALVAFHISSSDAGKISDSLLSKLEGGESSDAILELPSIFGDVMSNPILNLLSGNARTDMMVNLMKQATSASQAPFMNAISGLGLAEAATPFWISNDISLKGLDISAAKSLAALPGLFTLREPETVKINPVVVHDRKVRQSSAQWGVQKIQAPYVWDRKTRGAGVVVAGIDTGVYRDHESIRDNYGGKWYDPVYGYSQPTDSQGHGTHTISTIVGRTYGIGVAPDAKWIACRGLDNNGNGNESWLKSCGQWVLNQKPKIVSNSWGSKTGGQTFYNDVINAWRQAGIIPVFSIGNEGPNCRTAGSPGDQANIISVGSTKSDDSMSDFSSRGYASNGKLKPEVSAPGDEIPAAYYTGPSDYVYMSGTSMACPHVAGAVALMLSANPSMTFDQVLSALSKQADRPAVASNDLSCGKNSTASYPLDFQRHKSQGIGHFGCQVPRSPSWPLYTQGA